MRIFVAGASGVIGRRLVPLLVEAGHTVAGMMRSPDSEELLRSLGAEPVVCDAYDLVALKEALGTFGPDMVINQMTDLPDDPREMERFRRKNARMQGEGVVNLVEAATSAGVKRFLTQSVVWEIPGKMGAAYREMERSVLDMGGTVMRFGLFYGPDTYTTTPPAGQPAIHIDEAARRVLDALDAPSGIIEIVETSSPDGKPPADG